MIIWTAAVCFVVALVSREWMRTITGPATTDDVLQRSLLLVSGAWFVSLVLPRMWDLLT